MIFSGEEPGSVENELVLEHLSRGHAGLVYTCQAVNNALVDPVVADVKLDMFRKFPFLEVLIRVYGLRR